MFGIDKERIALLKREYKLINDSLFDSNLSTMEKEFLASQACVIADELFALDPDFKFS